MMKLLAELKRRQMFRVAAAYVVVGWLLLQVYNNLTPVMRLPDWAGTLVVVLLVGGLPITLLAAWARELAPHDGATERFGASKLDYVLIGALVLVIALMSYQQLASVPSPGTSAQQRASIAPTARQPQLGDLAIAVLPFTNLSGDVSQEFFSDGMTEEITSALAKVQGLTVLARTSAFQFKTQNRDIRAIGEALNARYLIEGSVRKAGDRVRITAQLVQAESGANVWTESYDRQLTDVFAIQEDIAQAIASALRVPLGLAQGDTLVRDRTKDLESYDQYLRARTLVRARALPDAIELLESVVARDPGFAPAWGLLAQAYVLVPLNSPEPLASTLEEARRIVQTFADKAERAAREAIRLDSRNGLAFAVLARIQSRRGEWVAADDLYKQALALDPNEPEVLHIYSNMLASAARFKEALSLREKLRALEPFVPIYNVFTAQLMMISGQGQAAIPILEAIPTADATRNTELAQAYAAEGRYAEAADLLLAISPNSVRRRSVEDAARLLRTAPTKVAAPESLPVLEDLLNFVYVYVGAPDRVLEASERGLEIGLWDSSSTRTIWRPLYAPLRKTERFKTFVRNAGLVEYWRERGWPEFCRPVGADDFECD